MNHNTAFIRLRIFECDEFEFLGTNKIFGEPDESWRKGDLRKGGGRKWKKSGCEFVRNFDPCIDANIIINDFLSDKIINPPGTTHPLSQINKENQLEFILSLIYYVDKAPSLYFERSTLKSLARLNVDFDIDIIDV